MREITRPLPSLCLALLAALPLASIGAQELTGTIRFPDGATPAPGILLIASRPADAVVVARAVTGSGGSFVLRVPPGELSLRALRVGYRPTNLGRISLGPGERRRIDFTLSDVPVVLASVTTRAAARCAVADRAGGDVATLFDEARKALLASQLSPPEGRPSARILLEQSVEEPDGTPRVRPVREVRSGMAARPFRSAPPAQLAALGYRIEERDGTTFFAPDANVLLSEQFGATHCLRLARADPARPDRVGITFEPVGRARGLIRIRGTLWLERATFGLERLEFGYVGLPAGLDDAGLGGSIDFTQLSDGLWFEDRWEIRMPRLRIERQTRVGGITPDGPSELMRLDAIQRAGGRVLSIERDGRVSYASAGNEPELGPRNDEEIMTTAMMLLRAACSSTPDDDGEPRSATVGLVSEPDARPSDGARVVATWQESHRIGADDRITWKEPTLTAIAESDGFYALCRLPRERRFVLRAVQGQRRTPPLVLRFEADADHTRADLKFSGAP